MRKFVIGAAVLLSVFAVSCNKDKDMKKATIVDTGDVAQGGCGYIIKLEEDNAMLKPEYLQSAYQHNGMKVKVKYTTEGQQQVCSTNPNNAVYEIIQVQDIKRNLD